MDVIMLNVFPIDFLIDHPMVQEMIGIFEKEVIKEGGVIEEIDFQKGCFRIQVSTEKSGLALKLFGEKLAEAKELITKSSN